MLTLNEKGFTLVELLIVLFCLCMLVLSFTVLPMWTQSNLEFWLSYIKHAPVHVPFWLAVASVFLGPFNWGANLLMALAQLIV